MATLPSTKTKIATSYQKDTWQPLGPLLKVKLLVGYM